MIKDGLCRRTVNSNVSRIRRIFRWAVAEELVPATVLTALEAIQGLRAGRSEAVESEPVRAVPTHLVEALKPFVARPIWAMIQLQMLTGMRSGEVTIMRACDLNMSGAIWEYTPHTHKMEHHHRQRLIFLGPQAQAIVRPFLTADLQAYLFAPREARRVCGDVGDVYTRDAYRRAITRACEQAFGMPPELRNPKRRLKKLPENERVAEHQRRLQAAAEWRKEHCWHPHQLRHTAATRIRREAGIETTRCVLGHSELSTTEIYAEADLARARDIMGKVG
jgi:integrase